MLFLHVTGHATLVPVALLRFIRGESVDLTLESPCSGGQRKFSTWEPLFCSDLQFEAGLSGFVPHIISTSLRSSVHDNIHARDNVRTDVHDNRAFLFWRRIPFFRLKWVECGSRRPDSKLVKCNSVMRRIRVVQWQAMQACFSTICFQWLTLRSGTHQMWSLWTEIQQCRGLRPRLRRLGCVQSDLHDQLDARSFNQDIEGWDVSKVRTMSERCSRALPLIRTSLVSLKGLVWGGGSPLVVYVKTCFL